MSVDRVPVRVERVAVDVVRPLRARVLRAGLPIAESVYDQDELPTTVHLAAYADDGSVVGCCTWFPERWPEGPDPDAAAWRLRGMATDPSVRGLGAGGLLLRRGLDEARQAGAALMWCQARTTAVGFYEHHGLRVVGAEFRTAHGVPHRVMWAPLGDV